MLLADESRSIAEIAYLVGYQNYRDFYRNFVKHEHVPPSQVRRKLAEEGHLRRPSPKGPARSVTQFWSKTEPSA